MKRSEPFFPVFYIARWVCGVFLRLFCRFQAIDSGQVPATGGCIVVTNHVSFLDPPAVAVGIPHRVIRFMARDTLFKKGFGGWLMRGMACIPLDRTKGDIAAIKAVLKVLGQGGVIGVFPEGTRSPSGELQPAKPGIGLLVAKAGVPVVPAYLSGTYQALPKGASWFRSARVVLRFGTPILPGELAVERGGGRAAYERVGAIVMGRIAALRPSGQASGA
jgi:1-acyl-sn-glycerol-3-phosphate acyltransferase